MKSIGFIPYSRLMERTMPNVHVNKRRGAAQGHVTRYNNLGGRFQEERYEVVEVFIKSETEDMNNGEG